MIFTICAVLVAVAVILFVIIHLCLDKKIIYKDLKNKHVVITGGSSGIGKAAAAEAVRLGADVTIIGRDLLKLTATVKELNTLRPPHLNQKIQYVSLDVTSDYDTIKKSLSALEDLVGPIFMLITCAGMCICGQFETMKPEHIKQMIDLNYFGTAYPTRYVLPGMKKRNEGLIVFVSTEAALLGIYGYSAYGAAKWAVRGLAESVLMELVGTNVRLTLAFPADTDTPGYVNEELTKPKETKLISGTGGLQSPEEVGKKLIWDALNGKIYSVYGTSGTLLTTLFCGTVESIQQIVLQVLFMGIIRAVTVGILLSFHKIVKNGLQERKVSENSKTE